MDIQTRYLKPQIERDLDAKMVFVAGPRQVGKTTLARSVAGAEAGYLNWDVAEHREQILRRRLPASDLWVFDEIHKYRPWRNYLKGLYDGRRPGQRILVTGSARLDLYRFGGDSLQGRYHLLRLHPLSVAELGLDTAAELGDLMTLGGFPEPYLSGSETEARRWSRQYRTLLVREEVAGLERVADLGTLELLTMALSDRVGSPFVSERPARGSAGEPQDGGPLGRDFGTAVRRVSPGAFRRPSAAGGAQGAEALPSGLVRGARAGGPIREPGGLSPAQVGSLRTGRGGSGP